MPSDFAIVAVKKQGESAWTCKICGAVLVVEAWDCCGKMKAHLWKEHKVASVQVGYNWMGYPHDTQSQS